MFRFAFGLRRVHVLAFQFRGDKLTETGKNKNKHKTRIKETCGKRPASGPDRKGDGTRLFGKKILSDNVGVGNRID